MTQLSEIVGLMLPRIPVDIRDKIEADESCAYLGCIEMLITLGLEEDADVITDKKTITDPKTGKERNAVTGYCTRDLSLSERWLASLYTYKVYLEQTHDELTRRAVNFKSLTFEIKSLDKQPEQFRNKIYDFNRWINNEISKALHTNTVVGKARKFGG